jgi:hypothetical protein
VDMTLPRLDRRQALKGAGLLGTAALAALIPVGVAADDQQSGQGGDAGVQGTWLVDVVPDAGTSAPHKVLIIYAQGGSVVASANDSPGTLYGAWSRANADQAGFTFEGFTFDPKSGAFAGILRVRGLASHDQETDTISGPARIEFQPPGGPFFPAGTTTFSGTRVRVLPL